MQGSAETEVVEKLAAMSPLTDDDTRAGLRTALQKVHGDIPVGAEGTKWKQRTRYVTRNLGLSFFYFGVYVAQNPAQSKREHLGISN